MAWSSRYHPLRDGEVLSCGRCPNRSGIVSGPIASNQDDKLTRADLILERQKSSGGTSRHNSTGQQTSRLPPSTHTSVIPAREAALNRVSHSQGPPLARIRSQPVMQDVPQGPFSTTSPSPTSIQATLPPSRRTQSNVLGGGFLRPLTRVGENSPIIRTQSSANLVPSGQSSPRSASPLALEAPAMTRRSTDGDGRASSDEMRRQELARRSETMDTSYRSHGW